MTPEDKSIILSLPHAPGKSPVGTPGDILRHFECSDGRKLGLTLLHEALENRDADEVELSMIVCSLFGGYDSEHLQVLLQLADADFHQQHESVVRLLGDLRSSAAVDVLERSTQRAPEYLVDDGAELARKATYALGKIPGPEAEAALTRLSDSDEEVIRRTARKLLARRKNE
ncbi:HEAT repeat domain-containing protein [Nocardia aurantia]|uniref:HEAT repeat domain-containing protein n=1 Tax=Nocardia aurantia TaxID=2585199 RepID=A0A7K0DH75_9NOCA|nr:HEAT repeat domain-containing protein [Nocardia aurantia]MQY25038.1 hypothetical protein [Nocardia aurantia]